jgi:hypothetical protein
MKQTQNVRKNMLLHNFSPFQTVSSRQASLDFSFYVVVALTYANAAQTSGSDLCWK